MSDNEAEGIRRLASPVCFMGEDAPLPVHPVDIARWRQVQRERLRAERLAMPAAVRTRIATALAAHLDRFFEESVGRRTGRVLSGYWPIKGEIDLRPWLAELHARGVRIALPVVETRAAPLVFRLWRPGMTMERGHWNILVPPADAQQVVPEICLAPLVGWDAQGYRLGYGGGYFDRTLAALNPLPFTVGVGLQGARLDSILPQPHDIPLAAIVTEGGVQALRSQRSLICLK